MEDLKKMNVVIRKTIILILLLFAVSCTKETPEPIDVSDKITMANDHGFEMFWDFSELPWDSYDMTMLFDYRNDEVVFRFYDEDGVEIGYARVTETG